MGLVAAVTGGTFTLAPAGTHEAVCVRVIDIGTQATPFADKKGDPKSAHQVIITWELSNEFIDDGKPFTISRYYTCSLHEKAWLRQHLEAWRGRPFTDDELTGFALKNVLGKPCLVCVVHEKKKDGSTKAKVSAVMAMAKGSKPPVQISPSLCFDMDNWDEHAFQQLGEYHQKQIMGSVEARERFGESGNGATVATEQNHEALPDDDIPFHHMPHDGFPCWS